MPLFGKKKSSESHTRKSRCSSLPNLNYEGSEFVCKPLSPVKMYPRTRGPRTSCPPGQLVLGLRVPLGHLALGPAVPLRTSSSIIPGCSAPPKLFFQPPFPTVSWEGGLPGAAKLLVKKSGELLVAHDSSLVTQRLYI